MTSSGTAGLTGAVLPLAIARINWAMPQYAALLQVVDSYYAHGYEYFSPAVLRAADLQRLDMRYRNT